MKKQEKSKHRGEKSNDRVVVLLVIAFLIVTIGLIVLLINLLINPNDNLILYFVSFAAADGIVIRFAKRILTLSFKSSVDHVEQAITGDEERVKVKRSGIRITLGVLCLMTITVSTLGFAVSTYYSQIPSDQKTDNEKRAFSEKPAYNFLEVINRNAWDDDSFYFFEAENQNEFVDNLVTSLECIEPIDPISYEELNIASGYGDIVDDANDHYNELKLLLRSDDNIVNGPLPEVCYEYILTVRGTMEETYVTPENRKEIMTCHILGGLNNLGNGPKYEYMQGVRYSWGVLVARMMWGEYWSEDVQNIITAYEHLQSAAPEQEDQLDFVIVSVKRMGLRLDEKYG